MIQSKYYGCSTLMDAADILWKYMSVYKQHYSWRFPQCLLRLTDASATLHFQNWRQNVQGQGKHFLFMEKRKALTIDNVSKTLHGVDSLIVKLFFIFYF